MVLVYIVFYYYKLWILCCHSYAYITTTCFLRIHMLHACINIKKKKEILHETSIKIGGISNGISQFPMECER